MIKTALLRILGGVVFPLLCIGAEEDTLKKSDLVSIECSVKAKSQSKNQGIWWSGFFGQVS